MPMKYAGFDLPSKRDCAFHRIGRHHIRNAAPDPKIAHHCILSSQVRVGDLLGCSGPTRIDYIH